MATHWASQTLSKLYEQDGSLHSQSEENTQNWALQSRKREALIGIFKFYLAMVPRYEILQLTLLHLCP
jgi:hypothetical protein